MFAETAAVRQLAISNPSFADFYKHAIAGSGLKITLQQAREAGYRVTLSKGVVHYDLRFHSRLGNADASPTVEELVMPFLECPQEGLIHAIWEASSLGELQELARKLRAVVRFSHTARGDIQGQVIMGHHLALVLQMIESGLRTLSTGDSVLDTVTRNLGLRHKVRELVETDAATSPVEDELTDSGLARSMLKQWRR